MFDNTMALEQSFGNIIHWQFAIGCDHKGARHRGLQLAARPFWLLRCGRYTSQEIRSGTAQIWPTVTLLPNRIESKYCPMSRRRVICTAHFVIHDACNSVHQLAVCLYFWFGQVRKWLPRMPLTLSRWPLSRLHSVWSRECGLRHSVWDCIRVR